MSTTLPISAKRLQILRILSLVDNMTARDVNQQCDLLKDATEASQMLMSMASRDPALVEKIETKPITWQISDEGRAALASGEVPVKKSGRTARVEAAETAAESEEADEAEEQEGVLDCAVWMSGDVSIIHGESNITLNADEASKIAGYLAQNLDADVFAQHVASLVLSRITAKLFDHPDDKRQPSPFDSEVGIPLSPLFTPNKFEAFLRQSRPATEAVSTDANCANAGAAPLEPTEATGLAGVELDGPKGIQIPVFTQQPEAMSRADQFAQTAARG